MTAQPRYFHGSRSSYLSIISPSVRYDKMPLLLLITQGFWFYFTFGRNPLCGSFIPSLVRDIQKHFHPTLVETFQQVAYVKGPGECNTNPPADPAGVRYACNFKSTINSRGPFTTRWPSYWSASNKNEFALNGKTKQQRNFIFSRKRRKSSAKKIPRTGRERKVTSSFGIWVNMLIRRVVATDRNL